MNQIKIIQIEKDELKSLKINFSIYDTTYGQALIASTIQGICYIGFGQREQMLQSVQRVYPLAELYEKTDGWHSKALDYIENRNMENLVLHIYGTEFQIEVWKSLMRVPFGELTTYKAIAAEIENPKAIRAVGSAIGRNPVSCIIPCHRIIRTDGGLGGYYWGIDVKKKMLEGEKQLSK